MIVTKEKNLEEDIESFLCSEAGGYYKSKDSQSLLYVEDGTYQVVDGHGYRDMPGKGIDIATLVNLVRPRSQKLGSVLRSSAIPILRRSSLRFFKMP